MIARSYRYVMDHESNPLRSLPKIVRFQLMTVLAFMWSSVFTIWVGSFYLFGPTVFGHVLLLAAILFTADLFGRARRPVSHRDAMRNPRDGTALYDDVWGA